MTIKLERWCDLYLEAGAYAAANDAWLIDGDQILDDIRDFVFNGLYAYQLDDITDQDLEEIVEEAFEAVQAYLHG